MAKLDFVGFEDHAFFPLPPSGQVTETLEFLTDVVLTHDGSEDRTPNRSVARKSFAFDIPTNLNTVQGPFNLAYQNLRGKWAVPLWSEGQFVGTVAGTEISVDPSISDFREDGLVLIYQNSRVWEVAQIATVGGDKITLTSSVGTIKQAFVVPICSALINGDAEFGRAGFSSAARLNFDALNPNGYPTKLGLLFALDVSGSMDFAADGGEQTRIQVARAELIATLEILKSAILNSNVQVDLSLCFWTTVAVTYEYISATTVDIDDAIARVNAIPANGGTVPLVPFQYANTFFGTTSPNTGDRTDIMFYITDADESTTAAATEAYNMIHRLSPFAGAKSVNIYAINITGSNINEALKVDNASDGNIAIVNAANPDAMFVRFMSAIEPVIGQQFEGYELLTLEPLSAGGEMTRQISKIEDRIDYDVGGFSVRSPWNYSRIGGTHSFATDDLSGMLWFKRFLYRRFGKSGAFYLPTFDRDLRFTSFSAERDYGYIEDDDFRAFSGDRQTIAIRFLDGSFQAVRITSATTSALGGYRLNFESPIEKPLSEVEYACYIGLARFDTDRFEIQWIGNQSAEIAINMMETEP